MEKAKKVMVADDDPGILDFISVLLEYEGYNVSTTLSGAEVLNIKDSLPDVFLLDIWMSGVDGRDICKQLKTKAETSKIPVLMISASKDIEQSALDAGADDFLAKPFEINDLLQKIEHYTSRAKNTG